MDLPTYTNIWRIEKRLYKLYDLRLPTPLPIVWIGVFVGVVAPWSLMLALLGLPFEAPWHVVYLVPPGIVTWLSTRPVIESKRLTELLQSQARYVGEPRTWCRMIPASEPAEIALTGRVWRAEPQPAEARGRAARKARQGQAKRAASPAREVRPVVAAAAAAAATAPVVRERTAPGMAPVPRRGTAPALEHAAPAEASNGKVPAATTPVERVFAPPPRSLPVPDSLPAQVKTREDKGHGDRAKGGVAPAVPIAQARQAPPVPDTPVAPADLTPVPASPISSNPAPAPASPVSVSSNPAPATPVSVSSNPVPASSVSPDQDPVPAASAAQDAPIGAEALRRLRRLAASAEAERAASFQAERPERPGQAERSAELERPGRLEAPRRPERLERPGPVPRPAAEVRPDVEHTGRIEHSKRAEPTEHVEPTGPAEPPSVVSPGVAGPADLPVREVPREETLPRSVPQVPREEAPLKNVPLKSVPVRADADAWAQHRKGQPMPAERPVDRQRPAGEQRSVHGERPTEEQRPVRRERPADELQPVRRERSADEQQPVRGERPADEQRPVEERWGRPHERQPGTPAGVSIRAVPAEPAASAGPVVPPVPVPRPGQAETKVRRVESVVGRDSAGGWRRLAQVVIGPGGGGRTDGSEIDEARAKALFTGSRRVVVLGCTGGAGQTTTALMLGHTLARYREDRVLAVDANTGTNALSGRIQAESPETLTSLLAGLDNVHGYLGMRAYTSRCASGLEVLAGDTDSGAEQRLSDRTLFSDRRLGQTVDMLDRHYKLIVVDPAAALAARVLPYADQLVLVVPASEDGPDAVAMTYEWLDGHGCADLRRRAVMVVNGVSRRSMGDVEQAEAVARGRCRAIVRVPWEDELAPGRSERVEPSHLRAPGRRAYLALAGVVVAGFGAAQAVRPSEEEVAQ
ncbi:TcpE family conjugal transfer membrane protein [Streptosporangium sp. NPDC051023]|uniref:TcpE family conjugal transfer membrane protein n=1 Tax=Streptosporangium sp. NPDC051023 TaxID=3155410 RepID=UPI003450FB34